MLQFLLILLNEIRSDYANECFLVVRGKRSDTDNLYGGVDSQEGEIVSRANEEAGAENGAPGRVAASGCAMAGCEASRLQRQVRGDAQLHSVAECSLAGLAAPL